MNPFSTWKDASWITNIRELYLSGAINTFLLHGNTSDRFIGPDGKVSNLRTLLDKTVFEKFDIILGFNFVQGIHVRRGNERFSASNKLAETMGKTDPQIGINALNVLAKFVIGLAERSEGKASSIALLIEDVHTIAPASNASGPDYDLATLIATLKSWSSEDFFRGQEFCAILVTENLTQVHPALTSTPRLQEIRVEMPDETLLSAVTRIYQTKDRTKAVFAEENADKLGDALKGVTLHTWESAILQMAQRKEVVTSAKIGGLKRLLIEKDAQDLLEFIPPNRSFKDLEGMDEVKQSIGLDLKLWNDGDIDAVPKGMVICGPVGPGKTFVVECLAGEAGVPVVKLKNFRNMWYGSTESNLERIFRLLRALGRVIVFIDEADQTLGKRDSNANDGGLSGRIYSMMAQEMGSADTRGKIMWVLASSRPDLIEIDLKRPGRVDVKIPLLPTANAAQSLKLIAALARRRKIALDPAAWEQKPNHPKAANLFGPKGVDDAVEIPVWLTPGAAEAIATHIYKILAKSKRDGTDLTPDQALIEVLKTYQAPINREAMRAQIDLALNECTNKSLIPADWR